MPPRCAIGVDGPTDTDDDLCILLRCTVKLTLLEAATKTKRLQVIFQNSNDCFSKTLQAKIKIVRKSQLNN